MTEDLHNIDNLFKSAIDGQEEDPSEESWKVIDKELDNGDIVSIRERYENLKKLVAVLLVLLFSVVGYELHTIKSPNALAVGSAKQQTIVYTTINNKDIIGTITQKHGVNLPTQSYSATSSITPQVPLNTTNQLSYTGQLPHKRYTKGRFTAHSSYNETIEQSDETAIDNSSNNKSDNSIKYDSSGVKSIPTQPLAKLDVADINHPATQQNKKSTNAPAKSAIASNNGKASRFSSTIFFAPNIASDHLFDDDDDDDHHHTNADSLKKGERCQSSFTLGALMEYSINKHWSIQSGLTFTNKVNSINPKFIYAENTGNGSVAYLFDCSSGYSYLPTKSGTTPSVGDSAQTSLSKNTLQYISIPLQAKYIITKGRFNFNALMGISLNILTKGDIKTEVATGSSTEDDDVVNKILGLQSDYLSGTIGIGAEYKLTNRLAINISPTMNLALTSITQNAPVKSYPNFCSFAAGFHIQL